MEVSSPESIGHGQRAGAAHHSQLGTPSLPLQGLGATSLLPTGQVRLKPSPEAQTGFVVLSAVEEELIHTGFVSDPLCYTIRRG